jgi:hypothetical protein
MGRKPTGKKPMTGVERTRRYRERLDPMNRVKALRRRYLALTAGEKAAFLDWLAKQK